MAKEESAYAQSAEELRAGKPAGPEHDGSFHAPDFFDPKTGKRHDTPWDSPGQSDLTADGTDEKGKVVVGLTEDDLAKSNAAHKK
jgi:Cu/Zn superoxide dismutase